MGRIVRYGVMLTFERKTVQVGRFDGWMWVSGIDGGLRTLGVCRGE